MIDIFNTEDKYVPSHLLYVWHHPHLDDFSVQAGNSAVDEEGEVTMSRELIVQMAEKIIAYTKRYRAPL